MLLCRLLFRKFEYKLFGPLGGIDFSLNLPAGFNPDYDRCPLIILMHGFMANRKLRPVSYLSKAFSEAGYAVLSFDFEAHGRSAGRFIDMTVSNEVADARAVFEYARSLPYVSSIGFLGHSQGGVVAGMLAGMLEDEGMRPDYLIQLAPAAVLKDDAIEGHCMMSKYDPLNPPEYVNVFFHKLGRKFILEAQKLPIIETSSKYGGPVCIIHGTNDKIVPVKYGQLYKDAYKNASLHLIEGEDHFLKTQRREITSIVLAFAGRSVPLR